MGTAVDFEKMRKRRQRVVMVKRLLALAGVMLFIGMALFLNQILVEESFSTKLSDIIESFGGTGYPVDLPGGVIGGAGSIRDNLIVQNDTNLYIYSPKGKTVRNIQKMSEQTVAVTSPSYMLTYTLGGKNFAVHSLSREMFSGSLEYGILCGDMNARGDFAVVAPVRQFASRVYVYNKKFEEIYNWSSPEYVTDISLSPGGDMMALNCISGEGGAIQSLLYIFRFVEEREKAAVAMALPDNLCLSVSFAGEDSIQVLTDKQYLVLNSLGEKKRGYDFAEGAQAEAVETHENRTLLLLREPDGKAEKLVLLGAQLEEEASADVTGVLDMALSRDSIYILTPRGIEVYNLRLELKSKFEKHGITHIHLVGNRLYYLTSDEICVLIQSDLTSAGSSGAFSR